MVWKALVREKAVDVNNVLVSTDEMSIIAKRYYNWRSWVDNVKILTDKRSNKTTQTKKKNDLSKFASKEMHILSIRLNDKEYGSVKRIAKSYNCSDIEAITLMIRKVLFECGEEY